MVNWQWRLQSIEKLRLKKISTKMILKMKKSAINQWIIRTILLQQAKKWWLIYRLMDFKSQWPNNLLKISYFKSHSRAHLARMIGVKWVEVLTTDQWWKKRVLMIEKIQGHLQKGWCPRLKNKIMMIQSLKHLALIRLMMLCMLMKNILMILRVSLEMSRLSKIQMSWL